MMINSELAHEIVQRALGDDEDPVSSAYRLEGGHRECAGAEVFDDEGLMSLIVGPSVEAPPIKRTPEERAAEISTLKRALRLSLQSPDAPETSFIVKPRQCVHSRAWDECRTCSLRENSNKTAAELFATGLEWHQCWKEEPTLWTAITMVRQAVVDIANLSKAMHEIVDLDVHELLTSL